MTAALAEGSFSSNSADSGFIRIEFAGPGPTRGSLSGHVQILLNRVPAHVQVALDLADRPVVGPVQAVQVVDLFGRKHGLDAHLLGAGRRWSQSDVLYKIPA